MVTDSRLSEVITIIGNKIADWQPRQLPNVLVRLLLLHLSHCRLDLLAHMTYLASIITISRIVTSIISIVRIISIINIEVGHHDFYPIIIIVCDHCPGDSFGHLFYL